MRRNRDLNQIKHSKIRALGKHTEKYGRKVSGLRETTVAGLRHWIPHLVPQSHSLTAVATNRPKAQPFVLTTREIMSKEPHPKEEQAQFPTCENCAHMIRKNGAQDILVCVPHLKDVPGNSSLACELHAIKNKKLEVR
jgi:hypothetical protein